MIEFKRRLFPEKNRYKWLGWLRWIWMLMMLGLALLLYYLVRIMKR